MKSITEELVKASHDMQFARDSLLEALSKCTATESIILLSMIERTTILEKEIEALQNAHRICFRDYTEASK